MAENRAVRKSLKLLRSDILYAFPCIQGRFTPQRTTFDIYSFTEIDTLRQ